MINSVGKGVFIVKVSGITIIVGAFELNILFEIITQGLSQVWLYHFFWY